MHARVSTFKIDLADEAQVTQIFSDAAPRGYSGFQGAWLLLNRTTGQAMTLSLWDSEGAAQASVPALQQAFQKAGALIKGEPTRSTYDVVVQS